MTGGELAACPIRLSLSPSDNMTPHIARSRALPAAGLVLLTSVAIGIPATSAAAAAPTRPHGETFGPSSDPLQPPAGWSGDSTSGRWEYDQPSVLSWNMVDANNQLVVTDYTTTEVPADSVFIDLFQSTTDVRRVGERIDYVLVLRRAAAPFNPLPDTYPGATYTAYSSDISFSLNLLGLVDNVASLSDADFAVSGVAQPNLSFSDGYLQGRVTFEPDQDTAEIRFSVIYTGRGDGAMTAQASAQQMFAYYMARTDAQTSFAVKAPTLDVFKTADVTEVADAGDTVTYTVQLDRGDSAAAPVTITDAMPDVLADSEAFSADDFSFDAASRDAITALDVTENGYSLRSEWPNDPVTGHPLESWEFSYTVTYDGSSDADALGNTVCADNTFVVACDSLFVAVSEPTPPVDPTTPPVDPTTPVDPPAQPSPPVTQPEESPVVPAPGETDAPDAAAPSPEPEAAPALAATGGSLATGAALLGGALAAVGGALKLRSRRHRRDAAN